MRSEPDILVVGGGIAGLFCAYHLRRAGCGVTVVECGAVGGPQSCSSQNTGFVGTHGATPLAGPGVIAQGLHRLLNPRSPFHVRLRADRELLVWLRHFRRACTEERARAGFRALVDLKLRSLQMLREVCAPGGLADRFTARGMVLLFKTPEGYETACRSVPQAVHSGVPLRVLGFDELRAIEPDVTYDVTGALYNTDGAALYVPGFVVEFGRTLQAMGVEVEPHTQVVGFEVADRRVRRVRTTRGDVRPGEVVIAAGAWSAECVRDLGIGLPLQPAKGYSVTVPTPRRAPRLPTALSEGKVAVMPLGDRLRFGGTLELSGLRTTVSRRRVDGILRTVRSYLPDLVVDVPAETWSGLRPCTPDSLPLLGRVAPYRNLSVACGGGHIGMGLAPASGRLVAQIVTGERPDVDITPFRVDRYGGRWPWRVGRRRTTT